MNADLIECDKIIRKNLYPICNGMSYIILNPYASKFVSKELIIMINFGRYYQEFEIRFGFPKGVLYEKKDYKDETYNLSLFMEEYENGSLWNSYKEQKGIDTGNTRLNHVIKMIIFLWAHKDIFLDEEKCREVQKKIKKKIVKTIISRNNFDIYVYAYDKLDNETVPKFWENIAGYEHGEKVWHINGMEKYPCWNKDGFIKINQFLDKDDLDVIDASGNIYDLNPETGEVTLKQEAKKY